MPADPLTTQCPAGVRTKSPILDYLTVVTPYRDEDSVAIDLPPVVPDTRVPVMSIYSDAPLTPDTGARPASRGVGWDTADEVSLRAELNTLAEEISALTNGEELLPPIRSAVEKLSSSVRSDLSKITAIYKKWNSATIKASGGTTKQTRSPSPVRLSLTQSRNQIRDKAITVTAANAVALFTAFSSLLGATDAWTAGGNYSPSALPPVFWQGMLEARAHDRSRIRNLYERVLKGLHCASYLVAMNDSYVANRAAYEGRPPTQAEFVGSPRQATFVGSPSLDELKEATEATFVGGTTGGGLGTAIPAPDPGEPPTVPGTPTGPMVKKAAKPGLSGLEIAGIVVGGLVVVGGGAFLYRRSRRGPARR
jgi:hypothetical protein